MLIKVFCVLSMLNKLPPGVCWRGGGGGGGATGLLHKGGGATGLIPGLVAKQQAVEFPQVQTSLHNNTRSRRPTMTTTVRSNDTLVDTPFQLISDFFHVNQGVLCSEHAEQASSRGVSLHYAHPHTTIPAIQKKRNFSENSILLALYFEKVMVYQQVSCCMW